MKNFILFLTLSLVLGLFIKLYVIEIFTVPTDSMLPTIQVGKKVTVLKLFFSIEKNKIVAFEKDNENFVKRIKGLPHDTVYFDKSRKIFGMKEPGINNEIQQFLIPQKNDIVILKPENLLFYQSLIEKNEKTFITQLSDRIFIDGIETNKYQFKQNYYFVQGDNTATSIDSRSFGLITEKSIFGKVL